MVAMIILFFNFSKTIYFFTFLHVQFVTYIMLISFPKLDSRFCGIVTPFNNLQGRMGKDQFKFIT